MAKAYILTDADFIKLDKAMELWEAQTRERYPNAKSSDTSEGNILRRVRYDLVGWTNEVKSGS